MQKRQSKKRDNYYGLVTVPQAGAAVGYGQPRVPGKYVNPHPRIRRSMADWLDEPIDRNAERLFDFAAEFWGDECLVKFSGTKE